MEIIVVAVIIAIAAAMIVPRFSGTARQESDVAVERVAELVRLFAYRQALSSQQVAVWRDGADGRLMLLVMDVNPDDPDAAPDWRPDRFAAPVVLPQGLEITDVLMDDRRLPVDEWMIASSPGGSRPKIEIRLAGNGLASTIALPSGSASVVRVDEGREAPFVRVPIDLQQAGRDREPW